LTKTIQLTIPTGVTASKAKLKVMAIADYQNVISEINNVSHNRRTNYIYIRHYRPDLWILEITSPDPERHIGRKILIRGRIRNIGAKAVDSFLITLKNA
jgi:hypothetical protein